MGKIFAAGEGSVWVKQNPGPGVPYQFLQGHGAGAFNEPGETATPYYEASGTEQGKFVEIDVTTVPGGRTTFSFLSYYKDVLQAIEQLQPPFNVQFRHKSKGANTGDPLSWSKIMLFLNARKGQRSSTEPVALTPDLAKAISITVNADAERVVSLVPITLTRIASDQVPGATAIAVLRSMNRDPRRGRVTDVGAIVYVGISPAVATAPALMKSVDYGATYVATAAPPLAVSSIIQAVLLIGSRVVVADGTLNATLAYSDDGGATWQTVTGAGANILKGAASAGWYVYFVAKNGYIYVSRDGGRTLVVQDAGVASTGDWARVAVLPTLAGYAVGAANAMAKTVDGEHWTALVGPHAATALTAVDVLNESLVWVGEASGKLWYTEDGGLTWTQTRFSGDGAGSIADVKFARDPSTGKVDPEVGFMIQTVAGVSKVFRTVDGGNTWISGGDGLSLTPANAGLVQLEVLNENKIYAVGPAMGALAMVMQGS